MLDTPRLLTIAGIGFCLSLPGCDHDDHDRVPPVAHAGTDHGDHNDHSDHADHSHAEGDHPIDAPLPDSGPLADGHGGASHALGTITVAGAVLRVSMTGDIAPSTVMHFDIVQTAGPTRSTLRLWIGNEAATGSLKTKSKAHGGHFHAHVEAPETLTTDTALWLEANTASGDRERASVPLNEAILGHPPK